MFCSVCKAATTTRCSNCKHPYCGKECQIKDWKNHKDKCSTISEKEKSPREERMDALDWDWFKKYEPYLSLKMKKWKRSNNDYDCLILMERDIDLIIPGNAIKFSQSAACTKETESHLIKLFSELKEDQFLVILPHEEYMNVYVANFGAENHVTT